MKMLKTKNIRFRVIAGILSLVICLNTVFTTNLVVYAEEVPGVETNATRTYNETEVTEGQDYPASSVDEVMPTAAGNGMPTNLGDNNSEPPQNTTLGHYEEKEVWVIDGYAPKEIPVPAVYEIVKEYVPSQRVLTDVVVPGHYETVFVPTQEVRTQKWVERKETTVARWVPSTTAYRNVTTPGYWTSVSNTIPGHYETKSVYVPPKTTRVRIKTGSSYRYVTRTIPGKYESRRVWVASKTVSKRVYIQPKTNRVPYTVPGHTVYDKKVEEGHYEEIVSSIPGHNEPVWVEAKTTKEWKTIPEKVIEKEVLVSAAWTRTVVEPYGHYEKVREWIAKDDNTSSANSTNTNTESTEAIETNTESTETIETNTESISEEETNWISNITKAASKVVDVMTSTVVIPGTNPVDIPLSPFTQTKIRITASTSVSAGGVSAGSSGISVSDENTKFLIGVDGSATIEEALTVANKDIAGYAAIQENGGYYLTPILSDDNISVQAGTGVIVEDGTEYIAGCFKLENKIDNEPSTKIKVEFMYDEKGEDEYREAVNKACLVAAAAVGIVALGCIVTASCGTLSGAAVPAMAGLATFIGNAFQTMSPVFT